MELFISPKYNLRFENKETGEIKYAKVADPWEALIRFGGKYGSPDTAERRTRFEAALKRSTEDFAEAAKAAKPWLKEQPKKRRRR